ncbi:hypothetical protein BD408DRAFT_463577 [Parasitella parasitica]|nr:hypothetical protein BD408DRAFT_463577 [Parasitella parasitica]
MKRYSVECMALLLILAYIYGNQATAVMVKDCEKLDTISPRKYYLQLSNFNCTARMVTTINGKNRLIERGLADLGTPTETKNYGTYKTSQDSATKTNTHSVSDTHADETYKGSSGQQQGNTSSKHQSNTSSDDSNQNHNVVDNDTTRGSGAFKEKPTNSSNNSYESAQPTQTEKDSDNGDESPSHTKEYATDDEKSSNTNTHGHATSSVKKDDDPNDDPTDASPASATRDYSRQNTSEVLAEPTTEEGASGSHEHERITKWQSLSITAESTFNNEPATTTAKEETTRRWKTTYGEPTHIIVTTASDIASKEWEKTTTTTTTTAVTMDWKPVATDHDKTATTWKPTATTDDPESLSATQVKEETITSMSKPSAATEKVPATEETQKTDIKTTTVSILSSVTSVDNAYLSSYLSGILNTDSAAVHHQQTASQTITTNIAINEIASSAAAAAATTSDRFQAISHAVTSNTEHLSFAMADSPATNNAETSQDITPTKSSSSIYYPSFTRSFSVASSTATPMLVLGSSTECTSDPHAVDEKCTFEYFCNAATHSCVFLLQNDSACYESFQCASSYCTDHICAAAPEAVQPNQGGRIAGATVGCVVGAAILLFGLIRWRKRSQTINRRMNKFHSNARPFYDATTTILPAIGSTVTPNYTNQGATRLSKYNFLAHMLNPEPPMTGQQQPYRSASNADHYAIPAAAAEGGAAMVEQVDYNPFRALHTDSWTEEDHQSLERSETKTFYSYI